MDTAAYSGSFDVTYGRGRAVIGEGSGGGGGGGGGGTTGLTLNGGGFTNQTFTLSNAYGGLASGITSIGAARIVSGDTLYLELGFTGSGAGSYPWGSTSTAFVMHSTPGSLKEFFSTPGSGTTTVTSYGSVGGNIVGTFSGKLYLVPGGTDSVTVTNGTFSALRVQ